MIKSIVGFDISSSTLAYSLLEFNEDTKEIKFILSNYIKPIKDGTIIERLVDTRNKVKAIIEQLRPDEIAIENIILFMKGASSANTITTLTSFNRMIGLLAYDMLNKQPTLISVMSIRSCIKRQANLPKIPKKEELPNILEQLLNFKFPWEYNKKNKIIEENYDKSDAISCAYVYIIKERLNEK